MDLGPLQKSHQNEILSQWNRNPNVI